VKIAGQKNAVFLPGSRRLRRRTGVVRPAAGTLFISIFKCYSVLRMCFVLERFNIENV
jgi:hypothetical protein